MFQAVRKFHHIFESDLLSDRFVKPIQSNQSHLLKLYAVCFLYWLEYLSKLPRNMYVITFLGGFNLTNKMPPVYV